MHLGWAETTAHPSRATNRPHHQQGSVHHTQSTLRETHYTIRHFTQNWTRHTAHTHARHIHLFTTNLNPSSFFPPLSLLCFLVDCCMCCLPMKRWSKNWVILTPITWLPKGWTRLHPQKKNKEEELQAHKGLFSKRNLSRQHKWVILSF